MRKFSHLLIHWACITFRLLLLIIIFIKPTHKIWTRSVVCCHRTFKRSYHRVLTLIRRWTQMLARRKTDDDDLKLRTTICFAVLLLLLFILWWRWLLKNTCMRFYCDVLAKRNELRHFWLKLSSKRLTLSAASSST